jgi:hypothetical protein
MSVPVLQGITIVALATAVVLLVWRAPVRVSPEPPSLPALSAQAPSVPASASAMADSVVDGNIFSLSREAPEGRTFAATATEMDPGEVTQGEYGADAGIVDTIITPDVASESVPALHGVVTGPLGRAALLRLDPHTAGSRLFRLGEGAAGYRVRSIGADRVELAGPAGTVVLELVAKGGIP